MARGRRSIRREGSFPDGRDLANRRQRRASLLGAGAIEHVLSLRLRSSDFTFDEERKVVESLAAEVGARKHRSGVIKLNAAKGTRNLHSVPTVHPPSSFAGDAKTDDRHPAARRDVRKAA